MRNFRAARVWDVSVLVLAGLLIGGYSYFVSRHRILWSDELFAWSLVTDPGWRHMLRAWNLGADSGGIGFYLLCRPWLDIFGHNAIAFRAFSATGVFAAFAALWFSLRRYYRPQVVGIVLFVVFFGSPMILWQTVQTRFYGLLLGAAGWSLYAMSRSAEESSAGQPSRRSTLWLTFFFNLVLVSTHAFGLLYSGLLLFAAVLDDLLSRRKRFAYYAAVVVSWPVVLAFSRTALHNLASVGQPWFWTTKPHPRDLAEAYFPALLIGSRHRLLMLLAGVMLVALVGYFGRSHVMEGLKRRRTVLIGAVVLLSAPILLWVLSQVGTSYFVDRYYLPYTFGIAVLFAEFLHVLFSDGWEKRSALSDILFATLAALLALTVSRNVLLAYPHQITFPPKDFTVGLAAMLPRGEPIVIPKTDIFDVMSVYQTTPERSILFPYDWELALDPRSPKWLVSAEREVEHAASAGYYPGQVVESQKLLQMLPRFAVVTDGSMPWFKIRVEDRPGWRVTKLGQYNNGFWSNTIWQVDRTP